MKTTYVTLVGDESVHPEYDSALKRVVRSLDQFHTMYIGDREVVSDKGEFENRSPIDRSVVIGHFQKGTSDHARAAIESAKVSFAEWRRTPWHERVRILLRAADLIDERRYDLAAEITYEVGKTRLEALAEVTEASDCIRYYAKVMQDNEGYERSTRLGASGERCRIVCMPLGVWTVVSPFNFPFMLANGMSVGALVTGNSIVLKPTSEAPLAGLMLYQIYRDAGVPPGVINYVTGPGASFEREFTSNHDVAGLAFTGSKQVGMRLYRQFLTNQPYPKQVVIEMGSKNPTIVTSKADLEKAVEGIVRAAFGYGGQKCSATSRVFVQRDVRIQFLQLLKTRVTQLVVGDPRRRDVFMGPLINEASIQRFVNAIAEARNAGGEVICGGRILSNEEFAKGYYVEPTVVTGLASNHRLFKDELFLPLLLVDEFATFDEALAKANDTEYGLTAGVFSEDRREIEQFMDQIQFGVVYANRRGGATTGAWPGAQTFVGWKASGVTGRGVGGPNYLLNFVREQSRTIASE